MQLEVLEDELHELTEQIQEMKSSYDEMKSQLQTNQVHYTITVCCMYRYFQQLCVCVCVCVCCDPLSLICSLRLKQNYWRRRYMVLYAQYWIVDYLYMYYYIHVHVYQIIAYYVQLVAKESQLNQLQAIQQHHRNDEVSQALDSLLYLTFVFLLILSLQTFMGYILWIDI